VKRRRVLAAGAALLFAQRAFAQPKPPRIHWTSSFAYTPDLVRGLFKARGRVEGRDLRLSFENVPEMMTPEEAAARAKRIVALRPDILVVEANLILGFLTNVRDIPIVFYNLALDPVAWGLVENLRRPGRNFTGTTLLYFEMLPKVCEQHSDAFLRVASLVPRVVVEVVKTENLVTPAATKGQSAGVQFTRVELRVANRGYLSTYGLSSAKKLPFSEPLRATFEAEGLKITAPSESVVELGHLSGWGQGLYNGVNIFFPWTRGNVHERFVTLVVEGKGKLRIRVGSARVGFRTVEVAI